MQHTAPFNGASRGVRASLAIGLALAVSACGFHLQGTGTLPQAMARTYVDTERPHSEFLQSLTEVLRQRGAELLDAPADGAAVLDITADETGQRVLSVSARNIPREYEVYYAVTFSLRVGAESLITNESLVVTLFAFADGAVTLLRGREETAFRVLEECQECGGSAAIGRSTDRGVWCVVGRSPDASNAVRCRLAEELHLFEGLDSPLAESAGVRFVDRTKSQTLDGFAAEPGIDGTKR